MTSSRPRLSANVPNEFEGRRVLVTLGVLAIVSGVDSRDTAGSEEQLAAARGVTWHVDANYDRELAREFGEALNRQRELHIDCYQAPKAA